MSVLTKKIEQEIKSLIIKSAEKSGFYSETLPDFCIETPGDRSHGDYSVNAAMVWAKALKQPPRVVATALSENIILGEYINSADVAGAGFINFTLTEKFYSDVLLEVINKGKDYGKSNYGADKKIIVEFVSANPTGPMHIGNARGGALGDSLASVLKAAGFFVQKEFYVNDAGNQIDKFGYSLEARYMQIYKGEENVPFPEDGYMGSDITARAKEFSLEYGDIYVETDSDTRKKALIDFALPKNIAGLKSDLEKYRIEYDNWFLESIVRNDGSMEKVLETLKSNGYTYENDGAIWFKSPENSEEKDFVLVRSNGLATYILPDIAYHYNKLVTRGFDVSIDVLGADHHGYQPRITNAMKALGIEESRMRFVLMQMVRLISDGEVIKASKRTGKSITLKTLLDEVPIDAARFFFNMRDPNTHLEFDLDLAVAEDTQNPVYYVQYAHARICSIIKLLASELITLNNVSDCNLSLLSTKEEKELIRHIANLTDEIVAVAETFDPSHITKYATVLATLFHKFYNNCRVKDENKSLMNARLALCVATKTVLENVLALLSVSAPEVM